jgi:hypothetical protein
VTTPLERDVEQQRATTAPWLLAAVGPVGGLIAALFVVSGIVVVTGLPRSADARAVYGLVGEALFGLSVFACTWPVARRCGGWHAAFGLSAPTEGQGRTILRWVGIQFGVRIVVATLLLNAVPALRHRHLGNLTGVSDLHPFGAACLLLAAVGVAPVVEELAFRGAMLRALMRRTTFWFAAVVSSIVFGALHAASVDSWAAVAFIVPTIAVFGLLQCVLVRRSGDLGPAIGVHAATNLIAAGLALLAAHSS